MNSFDKSISISDNASSEGDNLPKRRVLGVIFTGRLDHCRPRLVPGGDQLDSEALIGVPPQTDSIEPAAVRDGIVECFANKIADLY